MLTYMPPIRYVIYGEYHIFTKDEMEWTFTFSPVVRGLYR